MNRRERGEETRTRIMDAAEACFAQQGYSATGVAEVCERAGLSKGAFYHHFASKQALFVELLNRWLSRLEAQWQGTGSLASNAPEKLHAMAGMIGAIFRQAKGQFPIFLEFWTQAQRDPVLWEATIAPYRRYRGLFAAMIEEGIAQGNLAPVDPDLAAQVIVSLAVGLLLQGLLDPEGANWGQTAQDSVHLLLTGLERR